MQHYVVDKSGRERGREGVVVEYVKKKECKKNNIGSGGGEGRQGGGEGKQATEGEERRIEARKRKKKSSHLCSAIIKKRARSVSKRSLVVDPRCETEISHLRQRTVRGGKGLG